MQILLDFFWYDDLTQDVPEIYEMAIHIFGGKDSPKFSRKLEEIILRNMMHRQLKVY